MSYILVLIGKNNLEFIGKINCDKKLENEIINKTSLNIKKSKFGKFHFNGSNKYYVFDVPESDILGYHTTNCKHQLVCFEQNNMKINEIMNNIYVY
jgi:hypothetical protein